MSRADATELEVRLAQILLLALLLAFRCLRCQLGEAAGMARPHECVLTGALGPQLSSLKLASLLSPYSRSKEIADGMSESSVCCVPPLALLSSCFCLGTQGVNPLLSLCAPCVRALLTGLHEPLPEGSWHRQFSIGLQVPHLEDRCLGISGMTALRVQKAPSKSCAVHT